MKTCRFTIRGRVQGVGYREALRAEAERRCIDGWVRNRPDGSVEALARGDAGAIEALAAWARRGPPLARVTDVEVAAADDVPVPPGFHRLPTG